MTLNTFEWIVIAGAFSLAIAIIAFFLKRTMTRTDSHDADINEIKRTYATASTIDSHGKDINEIKRTYVTKGELKEIKSELRDETKVLAADVSEIKNNYLTKDDYYRKQVESDRKVDRIYELIMKEKGGHGNA